MRRAISADCTGEPPGELIIKATALRSGMAKARSIAGARAARVKPGRRPPRSPMTPDRRMTGTRGGGVRPSRVMARRINMRTNMGRETFASKAAPATDPASQIQRGAMAQDGVGRSGEPPICLVQHQSGRQSRRTADAAPGGNQNASGRDAGFGP